MDQLFSKWISSILWADEQWKKQYVIMRLMMMGISVIRKNGFRATFPVFNFATLIFFDCMCNDILAVLLIYHYVYF